MFTYKKLETNIELLGKWEQSNVFKYIQKVSEREQDTIECDSGCWIMNEDLEERKIWIGILNRVEYLDSSVAVWGNWITR